MSVIRIGGKKNSAAKKTTSKPAAKSTGAKRTATKPAARKTAAKPKATAKKAKPVGAPRGPRTPKTDPKILARHIKALEAAGTKREKAEAAHKEAVNSVHDAAQAALEDEVPMTLISEKLGVSRQWLYKMGSFSGRSNGNGKPKPRATTAAKRTAAKKPASTTRKPAAKKATTTKRNRIKR